MIAALAWTVAAAAAVAAQQGRAAKDQAMTVTRHATAAAAVRAALGAAPSAVVVGFGEIHQTAATASIPSALRRFTEQILPPLAPAMSHLIVETWMTTGRCGETERAVTADIQKTTERPAATENEIEAVLRRVASAGVTPRILSISCADYQAMRPAGQPVDYDRTLRVTERALEVSTLRALAERRRTFVAVYGGALHNDLHPNPLLAAYSYAPAVMAGTLGRYLEIDLVVPEYVLPPPTPPGKPPAVALAARRKAERENRGKYDWWLAYRSAEKPGPSRQAGRSSSVLLIRRSPKSFVLVFPPVPRSE
jgi:hypothetical protein